MGMQWHLLVVLIFISMVLCIFSCVLWSIFYWVWNQHLQCCWEEATYTKEEQTSCRTEALTATPYSKGVKRRGGQCGLACLSCEEAAGLQRGGDSQVSHSLIGTALLSSRPCLPASVSHLQCVKTHWGPLRPYPPDTSVRWI